MNADGTRRPPRHTSLLRHAVALFAGTVMAVAASAQTPSGTLAVKKVVVNNVGPSAPIPAVFNTTTHCSQNAAYPGSNTPVAVPGNQQVTQGPVVVVGIICSVTETLPPPVAKLDACKGRGATWSVSYSPPVTIVAGQLSVLTVTNTLTCDAPTGGSLQVHKNVVNTLGVPNPAAFQMTASCAGMAAVPLNVAPGQTVTVSNAVPDGTVCAVTETLPPSVKGVKACPSGTASWIQTNPGPQTVHLAQTTGIIITNTLTCDKGATTGTLSVRKVVVNNTGDPSVVPPMFNTTTHCSANAGSPGVNTPVAVPGGQTVTQSTPITAGFNCSVTETLPPPIAKLDACKGRGATWSVNYSPAVTIVAGQAATLTVTNTLTCGRPTGGSLQVHKNVVNTLGVPTPGAFQMTASCSGMAAAPLSVAPGQTVTVSNAIPGGTVCSVTETLPPSITDVKACPSGTASWIQTNPGPQAVQVAQTTGIIITNTLTCDKAAATGSLRVIKSVINSVPGSVTLPTAYPMTVTCTPGGPTNHAVSVPPGSAGATVTGIAAPSQCVVTEAALPPILNVKGCNNGSASWTTVGSPSSPASITAGGTATVTIRNTLACDKPTAADCPNPTQSTIGCRITVTVKRSKGPAIYAVNVSPAATAPTPNILPSTSSKCVINGNQMINQVTCWFNYNTNPTAVTLTATSSSGALPAGFNWSGACSGSNPVCVLSATQTQQLVTANYP